jgi:FkbM family methyltransferase
MNSRIRSFLRGYTTLLSNNRITMPLVAYVLAVPFRYVLRSLSKGATRSIVGRIFSWSPIIKIKDDSCIFIARLLTGESLVSRSDWEWKNIKSRLKRGYVVLDVGANIGKLTIKMAGQVGSEGQVIAVEPNPVSYRLLLENIKLNGCKNCMALDAAVSSEKGKSLLVADFLEPQATTMRPGAFTLRDPSTQGAIQIDVTTVDWIISNFLNGRRVNFCKIDVEGEEMSVLKGSKIFLRTTGLNLWIEVHEPRASSNEIEKLLRKNGFVTFRVRTLNLLSGDQFEKMRLVYVLALKQHR